MQGHTNPNHSPEVLVGPINIFCRHFCRTLKPVMANNAGCRQKNETHFNGLEVDDVYDV